MKKKVNLQLLKKITVNKLDSLVENEVWLSDLVEEIATEYSSSEFLTKLAHRKITQCSGVISNIAINNGWVKKKCYNDIRYSDCFVNDKPLLQRLAQIKLFRLKEGNNVNS